jgi:hypothetical protein
VVDVSVVLEYDAASYHTRRELKLQVMLASMIIMCMSSKDHIIALHGL